MAFKISGTFKHHHSGQIHRILYQHRPFDPANIVWISQRLPVPLPGAPESPEATVDGGPMLLAWAKMQLWEELRNG